MASCARGKSALKPVALPDGVITQWPDHCVICHVELYEVEGQVKDRRQVRELPPYAWWSPNTGWRPLRVRPVDI